MKPSQRSNFFIINYLSTLSSSITKIIIIRFELEKQREKLSSWNSIIHSNIMWVYIIFL